jgi:excisionase family DNA binding protein
MRDLIPPRTIRQAADELNISAHTIRAWVASRRIGHVRLGRAIRVPYGEIQRLLEQGTVPARTGPAPRS